MDPYPLSPILRHETGPGRAGADVTVTGRSGGERDRQKGAGEALMTEPFLKQPSGEDFWGGGLSCGLGVGGAAGVFAAVPAVRGCNVWWWGRTKRVCVRGFPRSRSL